MGGVAGHLRKFYHWRRRESSLAQKRLMAITYILVSAMEKQDMPVTREI